MRKIDDWYYQNDDDWLGSDPENVQSQAFETEEDEIRIQEWEGSWDWGELILVAICLDCGNALTGYSRTFGFRFCEICEVN